MQERFEQNLDKFVAAAAASEQLGSDQLHIKTNHVSPGNVCSSLSRSEPHRGNLKSEASFCILLAYLALGAAVARATVVDSQVGRARTLSDIAQVSEAETLKLCERQSLAILRPGEPMEAVASAKEHALGHRLRSLLGCSPNFSTVWTEVLGIWCRTAGKWLAGNRVVNLVQDGPFVLAIFGSDVDVVFLCRKGDVPLKPRLFNKLLYGRNPKTVPETFRNRGLRSFWEQSLLLARICKPSLASAVANSKRRLTRLWHVLAYNDAHTRVSVHTCV